MEDSEIKEIFGNQKVLIVDDDGFILFTMQKLLKKMGFVDINCVKNGELAVTEVKRANKKKDTSYSVILMDINMPVMSGYDAASLINPYINEGTILYVPILAVTA